MRDVSFELERGQSVGVIGANGAGKTTMMRILVGLDLQDAGSICYDGVAMEKEPQKLRGRIGWMPDAFNPPANMTVWEYVDFFARAFGLRGERRDAEVARVLEFCGLKELQERRVDKLSKGEQQRANMARMLIGDPELVVMDEPAAGLDPRARVEFKHCVRELQRQGKTLLISSHIVSELAEMCDAVMLMDKGQILRHTPCEALQAEPVVEHCQGLWYEFAVVGDAGAGEALVQGLQAAAAWEQAAVVSPGRVQALYVGAGDEALALELRALAAQHCLTEAVRRRVSLEQTVIDLMNGHE